MAKRYCFLNNEQALVFAAKVNGRREALAHYEAALAGDVTDIEREFLTRQAAILRGQISDLLAA